MKKVITCMQTRQTAPPELMLVAFLGLLSAAFTSKWCGMDHSERWFEANASKLGGKHFDKKYGRDKEGNRVKDDYHFDFDSFSKGNVSEYINPRTGKPNNYGYSDPFPTSKAKIVFWDFIL